MCGLEGPKPCDVSERAAGGDDSLFSCCRMGDPPMTIYVVYMPNRSGRTGRQPCTMVAGLSRPAMQPLRPRGHQPPVRYDVGPVEAPTPTSHRTQCLHTGHDSRASTVAPGPTSAERPLITR